MANYLYNGVELPALPEWDKEKYPYAVISDSGAVVNMYFVASDTPLDALYGFPQKAKFKLAVTILDEQDKHIGWGELSEENEDYSIPGYAFWSNHDIVSPYEGLLLKASYPIPVGGEPIDHTSLLMGCRVGQMIRGMRKQQKEDL